MLCHFLFSREDKIEDFLRNFQLLVFSDLLVIYEQLFFTLWSRPQNFTQARISYLLFSVTNQYVAIPQGEHNVLTVHLHETNSSICYIINHCVSIGRNFLFYSKRGERSNFLVRIVMTIGRNFLFCSLTKQNETFSCRNSNQTKHPENLIFSWPFEWRKKVNLIANVKMTTVTIT